MEFRKLSSGQVIEFLEKNGWQSSDDIYAQASNLFNTLSQNNANTFSLPVIDLYIATKLKPTLVSPQRYTRESILNANPQVISQFANLMNLPLDNNVRTRIIRILDFMELIYPLTIREVINKLPDTEIYYEILTSQPVDEYWTVDRLYRHSNDDFNQDYPPGGFNIHKRDNKQYLSLIMEPHEDFISGLGDLDLPANPENIRLVVPRTFQDSVTIGDDPSNREETTFQFVGIKPIDSRMLEYITVN